MSSTDNIGDGGLDPSSQCPQIHPHHGRNDPGAIQVPQDSEVPRDQVDQLQSSRLAVRPPPWEYGKAWRNANHEASPQDLRYRPYQPLRSEDIPEISVCPPGVIGPEQQQPPTAGPNLSNGSAQGYYQPTDPSMARNPDVVSLCGSNGSSTPRTVSPLSNLGGFSSATPMPRKVFHGQATGHAQTRSHQAQHRRTSSGHHAGPVGPRGPHVPHQRLQQALPPLPRQIDGQYMPRQRQGERWQRQERIQQQRERQYQRDLVPRPPPTTEQQALQQQGLEQHFQPREQHVYQRQAHSQQAYTQQLRQQQQHLHQHQGQRQQGHRRHRGHSQPHPPHAHAPRQMSFVPGNRYPVPQPHQNSIPDPTQMTFVPGSRYLVPGPGPRQDNVQDTTSRYPVVTSPSRQSRFLEEFNGPVQQVVESMGMRPVVPAQDDVPAQPVRSSHPYVNVQQNVPAQQYGPVHQYGMARPPETGQQYDSALSIKSPQPVSPNARAAVLALPDVSTNPAIWKDLGAPRRWSKADAQAGPLGGWTAGNDAGADNGTNDGASLETGNNAALDTGGGSFHSSKTVSSASTGNHCIVTATASGPSCTGIGEHSACPGGRNVIAATSASGGAAGGGSYFDTSDGGVMEAGFALDNFYEGKEGKEGKEDKVNDGGNGVVEEIVELDCGGVGGEVEGAVQQKAENGVEERSESEKDEWFEAAEQVEVEVTKEGCL